MRRKTQRETQRKTQRTTPWTAWVGLLALAVASAGCGEATFSASYYAPPIPLVDGGPVVPGDSGPIVPPDDAGPVVDAGPNCREVTTPAPAEAGTARVEGALGALVTCANCHVSPFADAPGFAADTDPGNNPKKNWPLVALPATGDPQYAAILAFNVAQLRTRAEGNLKGDAVQNAAFANYMRFGDAVVQFHNYPLPAAASDAMQAFVSDIQPTTDIVCDPVNPDDAGPCVPTVRDATPAELEAGLTDGLFSALSGNACAACHVFGAQGGIRWATDDKPAMLGGLGGLVADGQAPEETRMGAAMGLGGTYATGHAQYAERAGLHEDPLRGELSSLLDMIANGVEEPCD